MANKAARIHLILFTLVTLSYSQLSGGFSLSSITKPFSTLANYFSSSAQTNKEIYVLADIEGEWAKMESFLEKSNAFDVHHDEKKGISTLTFKKENSMFVFIGDAIDKGEGSLQIIMTLIKLKEQDPDRVQLLLGNRDINKMRLFWELLLAALDLSNPATKFSLDRFRLGEWEDKFETWIAQGKNKIDGVVVEYQHGANPETDIIIKLKWILEQTMGDPDNFEDFKREIGARDDRSACIAYILFVQHVLSRYLSLAQMIYLDEATGTLFVHGGLSKENFGYIPESALGKNDHRKIEIRTRTDLQEWIRDLNSWARDQIKAGIAGDMLTALPIIQYQEPTIITKANGKTGWGTPNKISVIHGRPWDTDFNLAPLDEEIALVLMNCGVSKLVFGHSPVGQVPVMLKTDLSKYGKSPFISVATDTSVTKPARNAAVKITKKQVTVFADYYHEKQTTPLALTYSSSNAKIGTAEIIEGKKYWHISSQLKAHWCSVNKMPFGLPEYLLS